METLRVLSLRYDISHNGRFYGERSAFSMGKFRNLPFREFQAQGRVPVVPVPTRGLYLNLTQGRFVKVDVCLVRLLWQASGLELFFSAAQKVVAMTGGLGARARKRL